MQRHDAHEPFERAGIKFTQDAHTARFDPFERMFFPVDRDARQPKRAEFTDTALWIVLGPIVHRRQPEGSVQSFGIGNKGPIPIILVYKLFAISVQI